MEQQFQEQADGIAAPDGATQPNGGTAPTAADEATAPRRPAPGTAALDRGADLLVRVLESPEPVALTAVAAAAGIPKSTASRLMSALERRGLVEQAGERGRLRPGPAIVRVAERGMLERNLIELARPSLDALAQLTGETINLAVPGPLGVEHIAQLESHHFLGAGQWVGRAVAYHNSANGKVFLAFGRGPLPDALAAPAVDAARLQAELDTVRATGFAVAVDELEPGLAAIAAPVRGAHGDVIAALSVTGPTLRMPPPRIAELQPELIDEARRLAVRLGNRNQGDEAP
jgi:DNA-binding IclR family transcriptional regulator